MDELAKTAQRLSREIDPGWSADHVEDCLTRYHGRVARRRELRRVAVGLACVGGAVLLVLGLSRLGGQDERRPELAGGTSQPRMAPLRFADGSLVTPLDPGTEIVSTSVSTDAVVVALDAGQARFEVARNPGRRFRVDAGEVQVEVIGTQFVVARSAHRVSVSVSHGIVRVAWRGNARELHAGERAMFPPEEAPAPALPEPPGPVEARNREPRATPPAVQAPAQPGARLDAHAPGPEVAVDTSSDHAAASDPAHTLAAGPRTIDELLMAADVARLSDRHQEAVLYLRRALALGPDPSREAVAAFTLGRVLLQQTGRADQAAEAFARARRAQPAGPLAEDALAREVEAWSRAGATELARLRAREYLDRYPGGQRANLVREHGRIP